MKNPVLHFHKFDIPGMRDSLNLCAVSGSPDQHALFVPPISWIVCSNLVGIARRWLFQPLSKILAIMGIFPKEGWYLGSISYDNV